MSISGIGWGAPNGLKWFWMPTFSPFPTFCKTRTFGWNLSTSQKCWLLCHFLLLIWEFFFCQLTFLNGHQSWKITARDLFFLQNSVNEPIFGSLFWIIVRKNLILGPFWLQGRVHNFCWPGTVFMVGLVEQAFCSIPAPTLIRKHKKCLELIREFFQILAHPPQIVRQQIPLVSVGGAADGKACADPRARTPNAAIDLPRKKFSLFWIYVSNILDLCFK